MPMLTEQVLALLAVAPMTARSLHSGIPETTVSRISAVLCRVRGQGRVHIAAWDRSEAGGHLYPRAVYALGSGPDARKPPRLSPRTYCERYKRKLAARQADAEYAVKRSRRVTSVWDFAAVRGAD